MGEAFHSTLYFHKAFQAAALTCLSEAGGGLLPETYPVVCSPAPGPLLHSQVAAAANGVQACQSVESNARTRKEKQAIT